MRINKDTKLVKIPAVRPVNPKVTNPDDVTVGMLATYYIGSDSYAYVVTGKPTRKSITVDWFDGKDEDKYIDEITGVEYVKDIKSITPNAGRTYSFRSKFNIWQEKGSYGRCGGLIVGYGVNYRDPSF